MTFAQRLFAACFATLLACTFVSAQQSAPSQSAVVPRLVNFSGKAVDRQGKAISGIAGASFAIYKDQYDGASLWMETQNVHSDAKGNYTVQLGATKPAGLPLELFSSGEARWLGVTVNGSEEQPRVLLLSVPYALKAADAETLGGKPISAFQLATPQSNNGSTSKSQPAAEQPNEIRCAGKAACKTGSVPLFSSNGGSAKVTDSVVTQSGTTVNIAGAETTTGSISAGGSMTAGGSITAGFVEGNSSSGTGVEGLTGTGTYGVYGENDNTTGGKGVFGLSTQGFEGFGVQGLATGSDGIGIGGSTGSFGNVAKSIFGTAPIGIIGDSSGYGIVAASDGSNALLAENNSTADTAVISNLGGGAPLFAAGTGGSLFLDGNGNLSVSGAITAGTKDFKIDHPLDPANKYLYHASIESSEMKNIYDGIATIDATGSATVTLPDWFEAVNCDFRYQLTALGAPGPNLHIAQEISNNQFTIAGGQPGMKVSWQVTGVRHDAYAKAHPLQVSVDKRAGERGYYIHPELYGTPAEKSLSAAHRAQMMRHASSK